MMNPSALLIYIILFIIYLLPQAMLINGIWLAFQGKSEIRPDGKKQDLNSMIFFPIKEFLTQSTKRKIFYEGEEHHKMLRQIYGYCPELMMVGTLGLIPSEYDKWLERKSLIEAALDIKIYLDQVKGMFNADIFNISFYREYTVYRFSKYIRKPIVECVICMASFYGMFTFLIPALILFKDPLIILFYLANTGCLAYLNYKIFKPL